MVSLVKRLIERNYPTKTNFILAVDKTKNKKLDNIIKSITKGVGSGLVKQEDNKSLPSYEELQINLKIKTSKFFEDKQGDDEDEEAFNKKKFPWHCEVIIYFNI